MSTLPPHPPRQLVGILATRGAGGGALRDEMLTIINQLILHVAVSHITPDSWPCSCSAQSKTGQRVTKLKKKKIKFCCKVIYEEWLPDIWGNANEEAVSHLWLCNCSILNFLIYEENFIVFFISVESGNCNVHSANVSATIICTKLAGQRTAVLTMTVPHTVSESTDSHDQAQASLGPRKPKLSSPLILLGPVHRLKRREGEPLLRTLNRWGTCILVNQRCRQLRGF